MLLCHSGRPLLGAISGKTSDSSYHAIELTSALGPLSEQGSNGVKQQYAIWAFAGAAFLVTLGIASWRNGLWNSDEPSAQPARAAVSHSTDVPSPVANPIPKDPFQAAGIRSAAPPPVQAQTTPSPPQPQPQPAPSVGNPPIPAGELPPTAPDPTYEQSQEEYKQRAKLMEEIASGARSRTQ